MPVIVKHIFCRCIRVVECIYCNHKTMVERDSFHVQYRTFPALGVHVLYSCYTTHDNMEPGQEWSFRSTLHRVTWEERERERGREGGRERGRNGEMKGRRKGQRKGWTVWIKEVNNEEVRGREMSEYFFLTVYELPT